MTTVTEQSDNEKYQCLKLDNQVCFSMYSAVNAIVRAYKPYLEKLDLTYPQYLIMMVLWDQDNVNIKTLTELTRLDSGSLTPILKRLEAKNILRRVQSSQDERVKVIQLTGDGHELKDQAVSIQGNMLCKIDLPMTSIHQLKQQCEQIIEHLK
ncbi:MAG: MarR family transcriptional regulator [Gammaproteobacteria bacterium]|nr:MAG: MarR family transcriptional regulator [Gammaproteobacteria bacterium]RKZ95131.1 MAG: MarR family transcriptional regulator [Gammaproteobacteria bacterium]RLA01847.1 MAG: MarR family transcriptional regulator [Gammaproteobacteria bacterium]